MLLFSAVACCDYEGGLTEEQDGTPVVISLTEEAQVRSVLADDLMDQVRSFGLYIYNANGHLEQTVTSEDTKVTVSLNRWMTYTVYALANIPQLPDPPSEEQEFIDMVYDVPYANLETTGIPMCGSVTLDAGAIQSGSATVELTRLVSRVSFPWTNRNCSPRT